jgi:hypothetical protein
MRRGMGRIAAVRRPASDPVPRSARPRRSCAPSGRAREDARDLARGRDPRDASSTASHSASAPGHRQSHVAAQRSAGPMNSASIPSTAAMASMLSIASPAFDLRDQADLRVGRCRVIRDRAVAAGAHVRPPGRGAPRGIQAGVATTASACSGVHHRHHDRLRPASSTCFRIQSSWPGTRTAAGVPVASKARSCPMITGSKGPCSASIRQ